MPSWSSITNSDDLPTTVAPGQRTRDDEVPDVLRSVDVVVIDLGHEAATGAVGRDAERLTQRRASGQVEDLHRAWSQGDLLLELRRPAGTPCRPTMISRRG